MKRKEIKALESEWAGSAILKAKLEYHKAEC